MELSDKDFVKGYLTSIRDIWEAWFNQEIGNKEREDRLDVYRTRLNRIVRGAAANEEIRVKEQIIAQEWTSKMIEQSGVVIKKCPPGVARGLATSNFIKGKHSGFSRAVPIESGDPKYDMYANALPAAIRHKVCAAGLDVRQLYKEYRIIGRDAMVAKYGDIS